jgi:hypothetical protein
MAKPVAIGSKPVMMPPMPHTVSGTTGCGTAPGFWMNSTLISVSG